MTNKAQDDLFEEWGATVRAARKNKASLAGVEPYLGTLAKAHHRAIANRDQCDALRRASQAATQQLQASLAECHDAAIRLRSFIKSKLGIHSEQLVAYGIKPRRRHAAGSKASCAGLAN